MILRPSKQQQLSGFTEDCSRLAATEPATGVLEKANVFVIIHQLGVFRNLTSTWHILG